MASTLVVVVIEVLLLDGQHYSIKRVRAVAASTM